jgi:DNA repair protein RadD
MEKEQEVRKASNAAIMSVQAMPKVNTYDIDRVTYGLHRKEGKPDSMRVDYWSGLRVMFSEWVCFEHGGFAAGKAQQWWAKRIVGDSYVPSTTQDALDYIEQNSDGEIDGGPYLKTPVSVTLNESGKFPDLVKFTWKADEPNSTHHHPRSSAPIPATV